jgi:hypothetical protein
MSLNTLSWRDRFYPKIWLIFGISLLLVSAILWIWLQLAARVTKENSFSDIDAAQKVVTVDRFPANLGSLTDIVPVHIVLSFNHQLLLVHMRVIGHCR